MMQKMESSRKAISVGGQAVIEGVMMRAPHTIATAVRRASGEIVVRTDPFESFLEKHKWLNIPILRGSIALVEMMMIGTRALQYSADIMMQDTEPNKPKKEKSGGALLGMTLAALALGIFIFFVGPLFITTHLLSIEKEAWLFNLAAGLIRATLFLLYLYFISRMKDIYRIFQFHGAEHVSIYTFENKEALIPENAMKYDTPHPRCGTSFLMFVMLCSIVAFAAIDSLYMALIGPISLAARLLIHLPLIPVVAGISYELIRFSGKYQKNPLAKIFLLPGLWLQRITTKPPDVSHVEVAMVALKSALGETLLKEYAAGEILGSMSMHECTVQEMA
jgi:uncharacterized protein YqhQ